MAFVIETGIPIPRKGHSRSELTTVLLSMNAGDSILVTDPWQQRSALRAGQNYHIGIVTRKIPSQGWRIWRVK